MVSTFEEITLLYRKEKNSFFKGKQSKVVRVHNLGPIANYQRCFLLEKEKHTKEKRNMTVFPTWGSDKADSKKIKSYSN